jgi:hypothetical protein
MSALAGTHLGFQATKKLRQITQQLLVITANSIFPGQESSMQATNASRKCVVFGEVLHHAHDHDC